MCKFSSKSGGVPFQISFFLGDLTRNDPITHIENNSQSVRKEMTLLKATPPPPTYKLIRKYQSLNTFRSY